MVSEARRVVFTSDFHIHPFRVCSRDGGRDRLLDGLSSLRQSLEIARGQRAAWVNLGDFKQPKSSWPQEALTGAHEILREYGDVEKVIVAGNHDAVGLGGSGASPFKDCATVVEHAVVVEVKTARLHLVCAPWNADRGRVRSLTELAKGELPLIGHTFLRGAALGPDDERLDIGVLVEEYGRFPVAFFGDVHKGQWRMPGDSRKGRPPAWADYPTIDVWPMEAEAFLVRKNGRWGGEVYYPGSPYQQNWGERNDPPKGALVADFDSGEVWLHPLRSPRFRHVELSTESDLALFAEAAKERYAGDFVRVVYSGPPCGALDKMSEVGRAFRSFRVVLRKEKLSEERAVEVHAGLSTTEILRRYVRARPPAGDAGRVLLAGERLAGKEGA